ncbi:TPA: phosphoribosylaminoimidazolesuccinocarboxamide synthase [Candidatus Woesearchaeota archaeon]|nr:phosphoribosylaminoimidazolesuccinocarboxamide synthase [Candidatus Woesearchaeota archaeon]HII69002.1 phosphoribosylaminoimidazolesuccinocarboxamide synthase [Candidatus Woesearchaeota archaeon]
MITKGSIRQNLGNTLLKTDFPFGKRYQGKVRDSYIASGKRVIIATDRISAFDKVLTTLPFKGQLLTQLSAFWFGKTMNAVPNALLDTPDPSVVVHKECRVHPIEMVVRGYLAGSAWRDYAAGKAISGIALPPGIRKYQKLAGPIITPSTKAASGHDLSISREEILSMNIITKPVYEQMEQYALALFAIGSDWCSRQGLILVDTKYEFGDDNGKLLVVDEIHTPDSSRFWYKDTYQKLFDKGEEQRPLDKEYLRAWLISKGFMGDGPVPVIPDEVKIEAVLRYNKAYEQITGGKLGVSEEPVLQRIERNLRKNGYI